MADLKIYLEEGIVTMCDQRSDFKLGTEEQVKHDKNLVGMFDAYNNMVKNESDAVTAQKQLEQQEEEANKKTIIEWVKTGLYGLGLAAGLGLSLLARKDEREGFMVDDKVPFLDKLRRDKP